MARTIELSILRGALGIFVAVVWPASASAQTRWSLRLEGAAGAGLSSPHDGALAGGALRLGVRAVGPLSTQLSVGHWRFVAPEQSAGSFTALTAGVRLAPRAGSVGRWFVDANAGVGISSDARFAFDVGAGFEFALSRRVSLGPTVRYTQVVGDPAGDTRALSAGLSLNIEIGALPASLPPADTDGDGVPDGADLCPDEPRWPNDDSSRLGCPAPDADGDGVPDADDLCAAVSVGASPDPARAGCPLPHQEDALSDRDHDMVPDNVDACPDQPGSPSNDNANGCARAGIAVLESSALPGMLPVRFAANRDAVGPEGESALGAVIQWFHAHPSVRRVSLQGHADASEANAMELSRRRAGSALRYLIQHGIAVNRLELHMYGSLRPATPDTSEQGRARNRRVEFVVRDPALPAVNGPPVARCSQLPPVLPSQLILSFGQRPDDDRDGVADWSDHCPHHAVAAPPAEDCDGCTDTDRDGVVDDEDLCLAEAIGAHAHPTRLGCPEDDGDHDGVVDRLDVCPDVPAGPHPDARRAGCADPDTDRDGVPIPADLCPDDPSGAQPDPSRAGCPAAPVDRDDDGVFDALDRCPDEAGAPSVDPAHRGCRDRIVYIRSQGRLRLRSAVAFAAHGDGLAETDPPTLLALRDVLRALPDDAHLALVLSATDVSRAQRRADTVRDWLIAHGIPGARIAAPQITEIRHGGDPTRESLWECRIIRPEH